MIMRYRVILHLSVGSFFTTSTVKSNERTFLLKSTEFLLRRAAEQLLFMTEVVETILSRMSHAYLLVGKEVPETCPQSRC
jgi:hypothetical protein